MEPQLFRIILPVSDIDKAAAFYSIVLGFDGMRVATNRHYFMCGGTILACVDPAAEGESRTAEPLSDYIYFAVDDLEATRARCQSAGAQLDVGDVHGAPAGAIVTRPWGERSFYMRDQWGNHVCFVDRTTTFTGR